MQRSLKGERLLKRLSVSLPVKSLQKIVVIQVGSEGCTKQLHAGAVLPAQLVSLVYNRDVTFLNRNCMKDPKEIRGRPSLREKLSQTLSDGPKSAQNEKREFYQANPPIGPYVKIGLYMAGAFALIWASQYALEAVAGMIRQYKNLKRAIRE